MGALKHPAGGLKIRSVGLQPNATTYSFKSGLFTYSKRRCLDFSTTTQSVFAFTGKDSGWYAAHPTPAAVTAKATISMVFLHTQEGSHFRSGTLACRNGASHRPRLAVGGGRLARKDEASSPIPVHGRPGYARAREYVSKPAYFPFSDTQRAWSADELNLSMFSIIIYDIQYIKYWQRLSDEFNGLR